MEKEIFETIVPSFIAEVLKQSSGILAIASSEVKQFFNVGLKKYLEKQSDKYSYIKTLLKGNTPVYLYDIYFHLNIKSENTLINTEIISSVFKKSKYITIIGDAGSGKSTLVKHLFLNSIEKKYGIPILIELRYLNDYNDSFEEYIYERIFENKLSQNANILERLLNNGKFIFFLDGFDDLIPTSKQKLFQV